MHLLDVIEKRRSIRSFKTTPVERHKIERILAAAQNAPSAGGLQSYLMVTVEKPETKAQLARVAHQDFLAAAPLVIVFFADRVHSELKYRTRGATLYCLQDATIAAAYAQLMATAEGLGACWVGAFDEICVSELLSAPEHLRPVVLLPIGYAAEQPVASPRRRMCELVVPEGWR